MNVKRQMPTALRGAGIALTALAATLLASGAEAGKPNPSPKWSTAKAFDVSPPLRQMPPTAKAYGLDPAAVYEVRPERGPRQQDQGHSGDGALQPAGAPASTTLQPLQSFEGLSNQDNFNLYGGRVNPPDPVGDVGPNHYVQMINLAYAVYDKQGNLLLGPTKIGDIWANYAIPDCAEASGDPIVLYDQLEDRWILTQFTAAGPEYWNCVAISVSGDPTGAYYRYAFSTGPNFPDYPKYGVWTNSYILTTREFGPTVEYGIGVYALEKNRMLAGDPKARAVSFFLDGNDPAILPLVGDGLLPPDIDGKRRPLDHAPAPIVGTQDDNAGYGATFDALNVWELSLEWRANPVASLSLAAQLPVAAFDSIFPCAPTARDCLPQPGITNPAQYLDILSYRQRPSWRLAYRNFGTYEALVTNQSVEAAPGVAGIRWYEIRRTGTKPTDPDVYSVYQQGTYAPADGVHRWMGSVAMDWQGNIAAGFSVVNGTSVYPGIRYAGRLASDPLGQLTIENTLIAGTGVQRTTNSRWGDYSSLNVDPTDDCTFWYTNEYYTAAGQSSSTAGWQTRIGSFRFPGCTAKD